MVNNKLLLQGEQRSIIVQNDNSQNYIDFVNWIKYLKHFTKEEKGVAFFFPDDKYVIQCLIKARKLNLIVS